MSIGILSFKDIAEVQSFDATRAITREVSHRGMWVNPRNNLPISRNGAAV